MKSCHVIHIIQNFASTLEFSAGLHPEARCAYATLSTTTHRKNIFLPALLELKQTGGENFQQKIEGLRVARRSQIWSELFLGEKRKKKVEKKRWDRLVGRGERRKRIKPNLIT